MKFAQQEITAIEEVVTKEECANLNELSELQLALVGGGIGEVVFG